MNMTCNEIKELTVPYLELDLEPSRVRDVTTHLNGCAGCRAEMEAVRQVLVRVKGMAVPDPGDQFWREFLHRVRHEMTRVQRTARRAELGQDSEVATGDLPAVVDADWHDYWEVDPDAALMEMAGHVDRQTMDRLLADI